MRNFHYGGTEPVGDMVRYLLPLQSFGASERSLLVSRQNYFPVFDLPFTYRAVVDSATIPDYAGIEDEDALMILLRGVSKIEHAEAYVNAVVTDTDQAHTVGFPSCFTTWSAMVWQHLGMQSLYLDKDVIIVAHSLGSGIAMDLVRRLRLQSHYRRYRCFTFGAPKTAYRNGLVVGRSDVWRYTCEGDPVPTLLPTYMEMPWFMFNNVNGRRQFDRLGHPSANIQLGTDNVVRVIGQRTGPYVRTKLALIDWLMGTENFGANRHALSHYISRFGSQPGIADTGGTSSGGDWGEPEYRGLPTPADLRRRTEEQARESIAETEANPTAWAESYVAQIPLADRPGIRVKIGRYRGKRCVKVNGEPIAFARTKKSVKELKAQIELALWS